MGDDDPAADGSDDDDDDGTPGPDASTDDGTGDDTGDDTTDDGADDGADDGGAVDVTACRELVPEAEVLPGHHPARFDYVMGEEKGCGQNQCHGATPGVGASTYTVGGTVYQDRTAGRPVAGATVYVTDNGGEGVARALVTDKNGFFWSTEPLTETFELAVTAGCPDEPLKMAGLAVGNCNNGVGCHASNQQIYSER